MNVVAFCACSGNVPLANVKVNISRVLEACGKEIPIYSGTDGAILKENESDASFYHGVDGLGGHPEI